MKLKEVVSTSDWKQRPQRSRRISPEIREIISRLDKTSRGEWVVISLTEQEKKRQPTIRGRISSAAAQLGFKVKFEMRAGDLGVQKA
ncbi:MAG: hypothetical protein OXG43_09665 [Chloroflexi bacterium]|nr:hypothetical protein [Chloroflexota bacterium]